MSRILITGASGFVGWHVVRQLAMTDMEVHAVARHHQDDFPENATFHPVNLLIEEEVSSLIKSVRPTHLLHLAWDARPGLFWQSPENLDWVAASIKLYREFAAAGGLRAVFAGSCAEYEWGANQVLSEKTSPIKPGTLYGESKDALRRIIEKASALNNISFAWGRLFWLYGPREQSGRLVSDLFSSLQSAKVFACSKGEQRRDFMHVEDAARAFVQLLNSDFQGAINIASGRAVLVSDIIRLGAELAGRPDLLRFGALPCRAGESEEIVADVGQLHKALKFEARYGLREGLENTLAWWLQRQETITEYKQ